VTSLDATTDATRRPFTGRRVRLGDLLLQGVAGIAALGWILDRTGVLASPVPRLVERAAASAAWVVVGLALAAIASELAATRALRTPRW